MHQRGDLTRIEAALRMRSIWEKVYSRKSNGSADGVVGRSLRRLLPLPTCPEYLRSAAMRTMAELNCPLPIRSKNTILLGHGSGGRLSSELLQDVFLRELGNPILSKLEDQAIVPIGSQRVAISTDSFVVKPLFFPGGDIGSLAVNGTVNDLAMCGATPLYLSAAFILEEGLSRE